MGSYVGMFTFKLSKDMLEIIDKYDVITRQKLMYMTPVEAKKAVRTLKLDTYVKEDLFWLYTHITGSELPTKTRKSMLIKAIQTA